MKNFQGLLQLNSDAWNEQDLSLYFIGPVFALARFTETASDSVGQIDWHKRVWLVNRQDA